MFRKGTVTRYDTIATYKMGDRSVAGAKNVRPRSGVQNPDRHDGRWTVTGACWARTRDVHGVSVLTVTHSIVTTPRRTRPCAYECRLRFRTCGVTSTPREG